MDITTAIVLSTAVLALLAQGVALFRALREVREIGGHIAEIHVVLNSRLDRFMAAIAADNLARGIAEGLATGLAQSKIMAPMAEIRGDGRKADVNKG